MNLENIEHLWKPPNLSNSQASSDRGLFVQKSPDELEAFISVSDDRVFLLRPILNGDEAQLRKLFSELSNNEIQMRFLHAIKRISDTQVLELSRTEYDRDMIFVLVGPGSSNEQELFGHVQLVSDPDGKRAEFAILVHSKLAGIGIGRVLMDHMISHARKMGYKEIYGETLVDNQAMLKLAAKLDFKFSESGDPGSVIMTLTF